MGVAGLWPVLEDCAKTRSLTALALEAFDNEHKCFRLGIDASIWFFHAEYGKEGENPELRTLFFRCAQLLRAPIIPLFIFDGPKRPEFKRGKHINRQANKLTTGMKRIIESYGFQHRTAPGEAEAELAYLNSIGVIDGVLTDDVDTYLFGAHTIVRNPSSTHAKAKADAKKSFVRVYRDIPFTRADLILVGLCAGGDYNQAGLPNCGIKTAVGLAKSGLSESLYDAALNKPRHELPAFLNTWREAVVKELATNASGLIGRKMGALSRKVPKEFPDIDVLLSYINPITSLSEGFPDYYREINRDWLKKEPSLPALASTCEFFFEWGFRDSIVKRSRTFLWPGIAFRVLRRYILDGLCDGVPVQFGQCTGIEGQKSFMREIHSSRTHASTDGTLEYRVEIDPSVFVKLVESGIQGTRRADDHEWMDDDSEDEEAKNEDPNAPLRVWLPAALVRRACPEMTEAYDDLLRRREEKKRPKGTRKKKVAAEVLSGDEEPTNTRPPATKSKSKAKRTLAVDDLNRIEEPIVAVNRTGEDMRTFFQVKKTVSTTSKKAVPQPSTASSSRTPSSIFTSTTVGSNLSPPTTSTTYVSTTISKSPPATPSKLIPVLDSIANAKKAPPPAPCTPRRAAMPYPCTLSPLDSDDDNFFANSDSEVEVFPPATPSPKKTPQKNRRPVSSDEEDSPNKSPRRSRVDTAKSPRKVRRDSSPLAGRAGTSTPLRRKPAPPVDPDVIIISSDEDSPPAKKPIVKRPTKKTAATSSNDVHPLLRARALR